MFKSEKCLCLIGGLVILAFAFVEYQDETLTFRNALAYIFSCWICVGGWHILDDSAKGNDVKVLNLYTWPNRYLKKTSPIIGEPSSGTLVMKIRLFVRNDLDMPLGKVCAQCAHALNKAVLDRMSASTVGGITTLTPTDSLLAVLKNASDIETSIQYGDLDFILGEAESDMSFIMDRGRTVFNEPTITVSWSTEGWGDVSNQPLQFDSGDIPFKQPIFVDRSNKLVDENTVIMASAMASTSLLVSLLDAESGNIKLKHDDPMLIWLKNGFGKTVVGCKKAAHFESCIGKLRDEQGYLESVMRNEKGTFLLAHYPISSGEIEAYTRNKYTRLLERL